MLGPHEKKILKDPFFFYKVNRFQFLTSLPQPQVIISHAEDLHLDQTVPWLNLASEVRSAHLRLCISVFPLCGGVNNRVAGRAQ